MTIQASLDRAADLTLDPTDWEAVRAAAHRALDAVLDYQQNIREKPVWREVPERSRAFLSSAAPRVGSEVATLVEEMLEHIVAYPAGHAHPRFWGWVAGTGTPIGMIADMLAAGVNASCGTFNDAPTRVEDQVLTWMRDLFDFPAGASGIITSGASMANVIGLAVGRDAILEGDIRGKGLAAVDATPMIYASAQVHSSVDKAMQLLGLGRDNLRKVAVDEAYRMRLDALEEAIVTDRDAGCAPVAVVASAGTVNTGAIDDLAAIAAIARRHGLWFHVDGAIGALAMISPRLRPLFRGIELADSLAFDFHKWLYVPYEAGCVLIRDGEQHRKSFTVAASYLAPPPGGIGARVDSSNTRGPQLSRGFKALKVWAQIKEYGYDRLGRLHDQNVAHAHYLAELIDGEADLERLAPVALNIVCFRFRPRALASSSWDALNQKLLIRLQQDGIAAPSHTRINGHFALRVANTNHRSRREDFELLVRETTRLGRELEDSWD